MRSPWPDARRRPTSLNCGRSCDGTESISELDARGSGSRGFDEIDQCVDRRRRSGETGDLVVGELGVDDLGPFVVAQSDGETDRAVDSADLALGDDLRGEHRGVAAREGLDDRCDRMGRGDLGGVTCGGVDQERLHRGSEIGRKLGYRRKGLIHRTPGDQIEDRGSDGHDLGGEAIERPIVA